MLFVNFQKGDQTNDDYLIRFQAYLDTFDDYDANVVNLVPCLEEGRLKEMNDKTVEPATKEELRAAREYVLKRRLAILLLIGADCERYRAMKNQMQQNMAMGTNNYPKLLDETMNIFNTFAKRSKGRVGKKNQKNESSAKVAFAQKSI